MKKTSLLLLVLCTWLSAWHTVAAQSFKFAFVTDTHIGSATGGAEEDLERTIADINSQPGIDFVLLTGDITEMGTDEELKKAKQIISQLKVPYYIVPGNHDTGWSESGGVSFIREFGSDKFVFEHKGLKFIGCASGPYVRMSDGHIPRDATVWLDSVLAKTPKNQPIVFINHYPLDNGLDNWYDAIDRLKKHNTQFSICGHGHQNRVADSEGLLGTMGRSNLRAKADIGGYNLVEMRQDSALFAERTPGVGTKPVWRRIALGSRSYQDGKTYPRPSFAVNDQYATTKKAWSYHSDANVISTPVSSQGLVIFGNSVGKVEALREKDGQKAWSFQTGGGVFSSPAAYKDKVIFGSGDGHIYALKAKTGKLAWKTKTDASVLGSPLVEKGIVYIGGSDGKFRALEAATGKQLWEFTGVEGAIVSTPLAYEGKIIFGAWDRHLYALNQKDGTLAWKWNNGSGNRMFSPAMVVPVAHDGVVYIVAPDRFITALDSKTGQALWRSKEATVRESIGISADKKLVYGKTMQDDVVAFETNKTAPKLAWRLKAGFGYEHIPSMLIEKDGAVFFGTKSGVVYSINPKTQQVNWAHKIDNSMVNTVNVLPKRRLLAATMDGKVEMLTY
ncbi:PQQ-binding-like beta-propeller repeat protein [Rufibacter glacialis]|uniref:PQQ-binding-like beta-propeller repeat protein n=1 Tax=Rufibacter glacialis TaxID=1259555 RepID=A0A5M8QNV1_9BACT|nr:PQQ-binding-like beta-propeller repeat protein [Rufibacter glacialis]KAA6437825.1 PQQ-binding-like beta-propeller repeat protein [Rufibacter glacialis]GGK56005.1 serine/threonine protein kinase [Rufibacter glacialis]